MSLIWWNPEKKCLVADTYACDNELFYGETKLHSVGKWRLAFTGDEMGETFVKHKLLFTNDLMELFGTTTVTNMEASMLIYDSKRDVLWNLNIADGGEIRIWELNVKRFKALGYGSSNVELLNNLNYSEGEIMGIILKHVANIAAPFERLNRDGSKETIETTED